jgi:hypothetical protein
MAAAVDEVGAAQPWVVSSSATQYAADEAPDGSFWFAGRSRIATM